MIRQAIKQLIKGEDLSSECMKETMEEIMEGRAVPSQVGSFLSLLRIKKESVNEITQAARVMREKAVPLKIDGDILDTCSTGGTGINHFNISTTVAFVVAGMGIKVAKHGNRAVSGRCGSADVLEKLGVDINMNPEQVKKCIEENGIGFLFAPSFHKAMKYAAGPRKELGIRTIFNILGPLTNPACATHQIMGVYDSELTEVLAQVLGNLGVKGAVVVHGDGGLDEITLSGATKISEFKNDFINNYELYPGDFGLKTYEIKHIKGGDEKKNAEILKGILQGEGGAYRDFTIANAAAAFVIADKAEDLRQGVEMAQESIDSGKAYKKLKALVEMK
ncbi:MAG: anthranilate phosphoribosyltransferase [Elusimicrobiota bacterium]